MPMDERRQDPDERIVAYQLGELNKRLERMEKWMEMSPDRFAVMIGVATQSLGKQVDDHESRLRDAEAWQSTMRGAFVVGGVLITMINVGIAAFAAHL